MSQNTEDSSTLEKRQENCFESALKKSDCREERRGHWWTLCQMEPPDRLCGNPFLPRVQFPPNRGTPAGPHRRSSGQQGRAILCPRVTRSARASADATSTLQICGSCGGGVLGSLLAMQGKLVPWQWPLGQSILPRAWGGGRRGNQVSFGEFSFLFSVGEAITDVGNGRCRPDQQGKGGPRRVPWAVE